MEAQDSMMREKYCEIAREISRMFDAKNTHILTEYSSHPGSDEVANFENLRSICMNEEVDLLSFFCHGSFNEEEPLLSALHIPPKRVTLIELMSNFRTNASLVTLIACTSAEPYIGPGGAIHSLAMAMIFCGAATVTGALWNAYTPSARRFLKEFISSWSSGMDKATALTKAQTELIKTKNFSHPYHWAPYILIGDWY